MQCCSRESDLSSASHLCHVWITDKSHKKKITYIAYRIQVDLRTINTAYTLFCVWVCSCSKHCSNLVLSDAILMSLRHLNVGCLSPVYLKSSVLQLVHIRSPKYATITQPVANISSAYPFLKCLHACCHSKTVEKVFCVGRGGSKVRKKTWGNHCLSLKGLFGFLSSFFYTQLLLFLTICISLCSCWLLFLQRLQENKHDDVRCSSYLLSLSLVQICYANLQCFAVVLLINYRFIEWLSALWFGPLYSRYRVNYSLHPVKPVISLGFLITVFFEETTTTRSLINPQVAFWSLY